MGVLLLPGKHPETGLPSGAALAARSVQEARAGHGGGLHLALDRRSYRRRGILGLCSLKTSGWVLYYLPAHNTIAVGRSQLGGR